MKSKAIKCKLILGKSKHLSHQIQKSSFYSSQLSLNLPEVQAYSSKHILIDKSTPHEVIQATDDNNSK